MAWGFSYCMALGIFLDQGSNRAPRTGRWILIHCTTREVPSQSFCNTVSPLHMNVFYSKSKFPSAVCVKVQRKPTSPTNTISYLVLSCESEVAQSCPTLCDPMDRSPPGSSAHGIFQSRVLEWVAISFSRGSSQPRDQTRISRIEGRCFLLYCSRFIIVFTQITYLKKQTHKNKTFLILQYNTLRNIVVYSTTAGIQALASSEKAELPTREGRRGERSKHWRIMRSRSLRESCNFTHAWNWCLRSCFFSGFNSIYLLKICPVTLGSSSVFLIIDAIIVLACILNSSCNLPIPS